MKKIYVTPSLIYDAIDGTDVVRTSPVRLDVGDFNEAWLVD